MRGPVGEFDYRELSILIHYEFLFLFAN